MSDTFGFRVTDEERQLITAVALRLERGESDAVRLLIRQAARDLGVMPANAGPNQDSHGVGEGSKRAAA